MKPRHAGRAVAFRYRDTPAPQYPGGMTSLATRPRLRQVFPGGGHIDLVPLPTDPPPLSVEDPLTAARLALALLLARHGTGRSGQYAPYSYAAFDADGVQVAAENDPQVRALAVALRGTDFGLQAQRAALAASGL